MTETDLPVLDAAERATLARRAERLRAPLRRVEEDEDVLWLAAFWLGSQRIGLPLGALCAAIPVSGLTPVPLAPRGVIGLVRFEGALIAALSLAALLGDRSWAKDPTLLLVVELASGHRLAVDCGEVPMPFVVPRRAVTEGQDDGIVRHVVDGAGGHPVAIVDLIRLAQAVERAHGR